MALSCHICLISPTSPAQGTLGTVCHCLQLESATMGPPFLLPHGKFPKAWVNMMWSTRHLPIPPLLGRRAMYSPQDGALVLVGGRGGAHVTANQFRIMWLNFLPWSSSSLSSGIVCLIQTAFGYLEPLILCCGSLLLSCVSPLLCLDDPVHFPTPDL